MSSLSVLNILRTIKERRSASRTELQQMTGLSWGTITSTTRQLLNRNLIRAETISTLKASRKGERLAINPDNHCMIGVEIGRKLVHCLMLNLAGEVLWHEEFTHTPAEDPTTVLEYAAGLIRNAMESPEHVSRICMGIGAAAPGAIDVKNGIMRFASQMPNWKNVPIRHILQNHFGPKVHLEHDPNCLAMAERWFGEAARAEHVLCVNLTDGVGMGVLIGGEVYRGSQQLAGEFGHMTVHPEGPVCGCGDHGCVEAYASVNAVVDFARSLGQEQSESLREIFSTRTPSVEELVHAAKAGDRAAIAAFERMGKFLGIGVANLVDIFNPDLIVLCGPMTVARDFFMPELDKQVEKHAWKHSNRQMLISQLGAKATAMGACGQVLQSVFEQDLLAAAELMQA